MKTDDGKDVKVNGGDCIVIDSDEEKSNHGEVKPMVNGDDGKVNGEDGKVNGEDGKVNGETKSESKVENTEQTDTKSDVQKKEENGDSKTADVVSPTVEKKEEASNSSDKSEVKKEETDKSEENRGDSPPLLENMDTALLDDAQSQSQNPTWAFIDTPEHLDALLVSLNPRGFRETALKAALLELRPLLVQSLRECPTDILSLPESGGEEKARIQVRVW